MKETTIAIDDLINDYVKNVRNELKARWDAWKIDISRIEEHEVVGALLARQVSLATQLINAPEIWNGHIAPIVLRSMADNYINLAWIFEDSVERSRRFIEYGLGQHKLMIEHKKKFLEDEGCIDVDNNPMIKDLEAWSNSQRYVFLTSVSVGDWADIDTRKRAEEAGCLDFYRHVYSPFSSATHSQWDHVSKYNLISCKNPLHRYHKIPHDSELYPDFTYPKLAAKYVEKAFKLFDRKLSIKMKVGSSSSQLNKSLGELFSEEWTEP